jgi:hypothetical protein
MYCCFEIRDPDNENNYMYVHRYFDEGTQRLLVMSINFTLFFGSFSVYSANGVGFT